MFFFVGLVPGLNCHRNCDQPPSSSRPIGTTGLDDKIERKTEWSAGHAWRRNAFKTKRSEANSLKIKFLELQRRIREARVKEEKWNFVFISVWPSFLDLSLQFQNFIFSKNRPLIHATTLTKFPQLINFFNFFFSAVHKNDRAFKCTDCDKMFSKKTNLEEHISAIHRQRRDFECQVCGKMFTRKFELKTHVQNVHDRVVEHCCEVCGKRFSALPYMKRHMKQCKGQNYLIYVPGVT